MTRASQHRLATCAALLAALAIIGRSLAVTPQSLTTLYAFTGENGDGAGPYAAVLYSANGPLYGTTAYGGIYNSGTVFELTPPGEGGGSWTETILHSFGGPGDGTYPYAAVISGLNGVLSGTTNYGGASGMGMVYQLSPPVGGAAPGPNPYCIILAASTALTPMPRWRWPQPACSTARRNWAALPDMEPCSR